MGLIRALVHSSIGKKLFVAAAGLLLCGFLVTHLAGNLLLLVGPDAFNHYAEALEKNPLLIPAEIGLVGLFLLHILTSLTLKLKNRHARPVAYEAAASKGGRTPGSRTMAISGILVLLFLIIHIKTFKFGDKSAGLFALVTRSFANAPYALFYVLVMSAIGLHLSHGFSSAFQTFGVNHPKYTPLIKGTGLAIAAAIAGGFALLPIWGCFLR